MDIETEVTLKMSGSEASVLYYLLGKTTGEWANKISDDEFTRAEIEQVIRDLRSIIAEGMIK